MKDCIFCKIIQKKLPSLCIYENKSTIVILPKEVEAKGHLLVIPKKHSENLFDISEKDFQSTIKTIQKISKFLKSKYEATGVNILNASGKDAQQSVFHLHFHIIPRFPNDGIDAEMKIKGNYNNQREEIYKSLKNLNVK